MAAPRSNESHPPVPGLLRQAREDLMVLTKARLSVLVVMTAAFGYLVATKGAGSFSWATFLHMVLGTTLVFVPFAFFYRPKTYLHD